MADRKISDLTALTTPASGDYVPIVDISEVAAASKNKRITIEELFQGIPVNVGIGTSSPGYALDVAASDTTAGIGYALRIRANATAGAGALQFTDSGVATQYGVLIFGANGVGTLQADGASSRLVFGTNSTERLRIDSSGNVGIGTSSPSSLLHLADAGDITVGTTTGTKIGTATTQKISLWNATPVVQPAAVANITTTATAGALPTPDGSVTIANTATPTVTELLEYCVELEAKLEDLLGKLRTVGIIAT